MHVCQSCGFEKWEEGPSLINSFLLSLQNWNVRAGPNCSCSGDAVCVLSALERAKQPCSLQILAFLNCLWAASVGLSHPKPCPTYACDEMLTG